MTEIIFLNTGVILSIAIAVALITQLLKQPLIISYIITGLICGPLFLNLVNSHQDFFEIFSEFGVILLLFLVGLSLNFNYLKQIGKVSIIVGLSQFLLTSFFGFVILLLLSFAKVSALYLAIAITFSSTIIITKLLSDKRENRSFYARYIIGLMLVQDMIAIMIMVLLPSFASSQSMLSSFLLVYSKSVVLFVLIYFLSRIVVVKVLDQVAQSKEFLFIFSLAWCFAIASLGQLAGLGLEVGAILAGLTLGSSVYRDEISSRLRPLRDFFIAIFFIILGSEMYVENITNIILPSIILSLFVLLGNPSILFFLFRRMHFNRRNSFLIGLTAAQVSEFGFVFLFVCARFGYIQNETLSVFTLVALITIFVSSYLIKYNSDLYLKVSPWLEKFGHDKHRDKSTKDKTYDVIVVGYHRLGWKICEALQEKKMSFAVIDIDPQAISKLKKRKIDHYFGDINDAEFLEDLPLTQAKLVISTLPYADDQIVFIRHIREKSKKPIIIANLSYSNLIEELYAAGADYVMMPHHISGEWLAGILKDKAWNRRTFNFLTRQQQKEMKLRFTLGHD